MEELGEKHRIPVTDILNYYIEYTTAAYREATVGYGHYDGFLDDSVLKGYAAAAGEDEILGFGTLEKYKRISTFSDTADVMYFIKPGYTGRGIGRKLLSRLEAEARELGIKKLVADISDDNRDSLEFHRNNGFREYGRLAGCWNKKGVSLGIVFMEKDLS